MSLPLNWQCPDTLSEIMQPLRIRAAVRVVLIGLAVGYLLGVFLAWW